MSATDDVKVTQYYASEDPIKPTSSKTGWLNFQENVSFNLSLPSGVGTYPRTVYVWFKDAYGNVSDRLEAGISLIVYDTTAPTAISVVIDGGSDNTTSTSVSLTLAATDDEAVTHIFF
jgi:hypothetical protein